MKTFLKNFSKQDIVLFHKVQHDPIDSILICKHPLRQVMTTTLGKVFHHVYLIIRFRISKRLVYFGVHFSSLIMPNSQTLEIELKQIKQKLTIHDVFVNYTTHFKEEFTYRPANYNCQTFTCDVLKASSLLKRDYISFIFEKAAYSQLTKRKPILNSLLNVGVDAYAFLKLKYNAFTKRKKGGNGKTKRLSKPLVS
jgi:hypothetical protein